MEGSAEDTDVDAAAFRTFRKFADSVPRARWGAVFLSLFSALLLGLVVIVLFFAVDHLIWKGVIPPFSSLTPGRQQAFREEWNRDLAKSTAVTMALDKIRPREVLAASDVTVIEEWQWQAAVRTKLAESVSPTAAEGYLDTVRAPSQRFGLLSLIVRERNPTAFRVYAAIARTLPFTWQGPDANLDYLSLLFGIAVLLIIGLTLTALAADYWAAEASLEVGTRLRRTIYAHATRLGLLTAKPSAAREAADLFTTNVEAVQDGMRASLRGSVWAPAAAVVLVTILLLANPLLTLAFLFTGTLVWLVLGESAARFSREGRRAARRSEARMAQMRECVNYLPLVKSYLMDRFSQTRLERQLTDYRTAEWKRLRGLALSRPLLYAMTTLAAVGVLYLAGRTVLAGHLSFAGLTMKIVAVALLVSAIRAGIAARLRRRRAMAAAMELEEFLERRVDPGQAIDAEFLLPMEKKLDVIEASVRESGTGRMLLDGVSFGVPAKTRVAIVASDDAERRALLGILSRFVDTSGGEVRIDGRNCRWVTLESLRTQVAVVAQSQSIFTDTVANNIGCGDAGFSMPQVIEAAKLAHAHAFVQRLPMGYETLIGDGGHSLRAGEKLRLSLARALLRDPSLLVVEEPREALDADSQDLLDDAYERAGATRTLLFFTQRESILRRADHVLVLHKGIIAVAGRHEDLMGESELYRRLVYKELQIAA